MINGERKRQGGVREELKAERGRENVRGMDRGEKEEEGREGVERKGKGGGMEETS